jgi:hypothetical protein
MGRTWHPYAPDQAFGRRGARDEEMVDAMLARMEARREPAPRAGNKASPSGSVTSVGSTKARWRSDPFSFSWGPQSDAPSTIAAGLEAAVHAREEGDG